MVDPDLRDVVCLHLAARDGAGEEGRAPPAVTAAGVADALELGDTTTARVRVLDALSELRAEGLVAAEERPVEGWEAPRTVYRPTEAGREHAAAVRERVRDREVEVTNGTTETVRLGDVGQYLEADGAPLVTALARLTDDGRVLLERRDGAEFVDREAPLETVTDAVEASLTRASGTVVVEGPPGIGKTALVEEALARVGETNPDIAVGRGACQPGPGDPYGPLRRAFADLSTGEGPLDELAGGAAAGAPTEPDGVATRREAVFEAVADDLRSLAAERPAVLFLDDLQWAGDATLALFTHLASTVTEWIYPVAFVVTVRSPEASQAPLAGALDRVRTAGTTTEVTLGPLDRDGTRAVLSGVLARRELPEAFVATVHDRTGGVPLYVRETARSLLESGAVDPVAGEFPTTPDAVSVPAAMSEQVDERLAALDDDSRSLVELAAVVGEHVPGGLLAAASDLPPATRREHVDLLVAGRFLEWVDPAGEGQAAPDVRFVGGGVRSAVLEGLPGERRRELHRRVAEATVAVHGDADAQAARVAHHLEEAGEPGRAVAHYRRAGDYAAETYAHDEAVANYERALDAAAAADAAGADRAAVLADLAGVHETVGDYDAALEAVDRGLAAAGERSRERCRLLGVRGRVQASRGEYEPAREAASEQHDIATALEDPALSSRARRLLGSVAHALGEYEQAHEHASEALALAREAGDRGDEAATLRTLGAVERDRGDYERAREHFEQSIALARELGDRLREADALDSLGDVARRRGDYDAAREHLEAGLELRRELGDRQGEAESLNNLGTVAFYRGDYAAARERYERSVGIARELGDRQREADNRNNLGMVAAETGDHEAAREQFERALEGKRALGDRRGEAATLNNLATNHFLQGDYAAARRYHERSLDILRELGDRQGVANNLNNLGMVARRQGDLAQAREYHEESLEMKRELGDRQGIANSLDNLGAVARRQGDHDAAAAHHRRSLELARELGNPAGEATSLDNLGLLASRRGDLRTAREYHEESLEQSRDLDDAQGEASSRANLGAVLVRLGEYDAARDHQRRALESAKERGDDETAASAARGLGLVARRRGDLATARQRFEEALALARALDDDEAEAMRLADLAVVAARRGEATTAREHAERAREGLADVVDPVRRAMRSIRLAEVALALGDDDRAADRAATARGDLEGVEAAYWTARSRALLGCVAARQDRPDAALDHWRSAVDTFEDIGAAPDALATLERVVEHCRRWEAAPVEEWRRRARAVAEDAPDPAVDAHAGWLAEEGCE